MRIAYLIIFLFGCDPIIYTIPDSCKKECAPYNVQSFTERSPFSNSIEQFIPLCRCNKNERVEYAK